MYCVKLFFFFFKSVGKTEGREVYFDRSGVAVFHNKKVGGD